MTQNTNVPVLEIISDVVCPWCYIGKKRLDNALNLMGPEVPLDIRWRAYELNPGVPVEGVGRDTHYERKFGSRQAAKQLIENITTNAHNDGLLMDYDKIERVPNTREAHRLIWFAQQHGIVDTIVDKLFRAYFVDGENIGEQSVLIDVATKAGIDRDEITRFLQSDEAKEVIDQEIAEARANGVHGVPAFLFNGRLLFSGAQSPETISLSIQKAIAKGL